MAGYGESVIHKVRTCASAILDEAFEPGLIERNPVRKLDKPSAQQSERPLLTADQLRALLGAVHGRDRLILRLFVTCGLRPEELFALRWNDWAPGSSGLARRSGATTSARRKLERVCQLCSFLPA